MVNFKLTSISYLLSTVDLAAIGFAISTFILMSVSYFLSTVDLAAIGFAVSTLNRYDQSID